MRFTTDFPGGNGRLLRAEEREWGWEIEFLAETKAGEPMPLWFYFRLDDLAGEKVRIRLANSRQCLGSAAGWSTNRPVCRFEGGEWRRVKHVENGFVRKNILETWFEMPLEGSSLEFAFFYPYNQAQMRESARECANAFDEDVIGFSVKGRPIYRYVNSEAHFHAENPSVYVISRQHASECTGTYEIDGMMRYLASPEGTEALDRVNWWFVPLMDVDGVEEGFYGKDQIFNDLNRSWAPWFARRAELVAVQYDLVGCRQDYNLRLMLDLHAPGHEERDTYFPVKGEMARNLRDELRRLWELLVRETDGMGYQRPSFNERPAGANTSSQTGWTSANFAESIGVPGAAFECTYQGERNGRDYVIEDYRNFGKCFVRAVSAFLLE